MAAPRGRPRLVRPADLRVLTGPVLRNIIALIPDLYSPSEAYAMQPGELVKAVIADNGETFKSIDLTALNADVFRDPSVIAYVIGLQNYVNSVIDERPLPPQAAADLSDEGLSAPAALEAYRARIKAAKDAEKAEKAAPKAPPAPPPAEVGPAVEEGPAAAQGPSDLDRLEAELSNAHKLIVAAMESLAKFRVLAEKHLAP